ncbi:carbohydrate-binding module family 18 protein [Chaetomium sp. MPI-CAGE-AT-0009]|nr:carbohydrate-binding module family 18 protein [Chaetomium sp. MPI-CAGE-AT-0009]
MVAASLTRGFLLLALGFSQQVIAACTLTITAKQGDTCATLASQAGITVTQFLRSNPSVTSCSQLVVGQSYCVEGIDDSGPTRSSGAPPQSSTPAGLVVSPDGNCGQGVTCAGSSTSDYCGDGCQAAFGNCGSGTGGPSPGEPVTVTVTSITSVTRTSVVTQTSTVTQSRATATATITRTVGTTVTVPATITSIIRLTTIVTSTSLRTSVTTRTVNVTSVTIDTITSIATSTRLVTATSTHLVTSGVCSTAPTRTTSRPTTTAPPDGRPTLPGTPSYCKNYDEIRRGDSCRDIADRNKLSLLDFYALNPSVSGTVLNLGFDCTPEFIDLVLSGLCQINCDALWEGYYVYFGSMKSVLGSNS